MTSTETKIQILSTKIARMDDLSAQLTKLNEGIRAMDTHGDENFARYCAALQTRQAIHQEMRSLVSES